MFVASLRRTCAVNITADYTSGLDEHIVACSRYCSGPDSIGVPGVPSNLDGMGVGIDEQENQHRVQSPSVDSRKVENHQADEQRKRPNLANHGRKGKLVPYFAQVC